MEFIGTYILVLRKLVDVNKLYLTGDGRLVITRSARIFWISFWLVFLVMMTAYSGNLVAALATQHIKLPFTTIDELAEDMTYQITVSEGSALQSLLQVNNLCGFVKRRKKKRIIKKNIENRPMVDYMIDFIGLEI